MGLDAWQVADRLSSCPGLCGLHAGPLGTIVTSTSSGPVVGIRVDTAMVVLGIMVGPGVDDEDVAAGVRASMSTVAPGLPVSLSFRKTAA